MMKRLCSGILRFFAEKKELSRKQRILCYFGICAFILLFCIALQPGSVLKTGFNFLRSPLLGVLNLFPVMVVVAVFYAIFGNLFYAAGISSLLLELLSLVNLIKMECRKDPLVPADFGLLGEAMVATGEYQLNLHLPYAAVILLCAVGFFLLGLKFKGRGKLWQRAVTLAVSLVLFVGSMFTVYPSVPLYDKLTASVGVPTYNVPQVFNDTGFLYCFLHNVNLYPVQKPQGYDAEEAAAWAKQTAQPAPEGPLPVNVIFVQCEAFSDIFDADAFAYTPEENPMYLFHQVASDPQAISGRIVVSNFGAGTANTEFDIITGIQTNMLNEIPTSAFRVVHKSTPSLARTYDCNGFETWFMHPGERWFYNRESVYNYLGIHDQTFQDAFAPGSTKGNRISDESFGQMLRDHYEAHVSASENPWFAFTVTIQNHQSYPWSKYEFRPEEAKLNIRVSDKTKETLSVYAEGIRDSSRLLYSLTEYFNERPEPVLLVFWGDHLPAMGANYSAYREVGLDIGNESDLSTVFDTYTTPYVIWGNRCYCDRYDFAARAEALELPEEGRISDIYLGELVYELTDMQGTDAYFDYLGSARRTLPVLCKGRYILPDGTKTETLNEAQQEVVDKLYRWGYYRVVDQKVEN